jgi:hypothetical protein
MIKLILTIFCVNSQFGEIGHGISAANQRDFMKPNSPILDHSSCTSYCVHDAVPPFVFDQEYSAAVMQVLEIRLDL